MLTKPRTVCACHSVAAIISARVAPLARFIIAMTSAFLFGRSAFGLLARFLARPAFFAALAFLVGARFVFGGGASAPDAFFSDSVVVFISFLLTGLRSSHRSLRFGKIASEIWRLG